MAFILLIGTLILDCQSGPQCAYRAWIHKHYMSTSFGSRLLGVANGSTPIWRYSETLFLCAAYVYGFYLDFKPLSLILSRALPYLQAVGIGGCWR